MQGNKSENIVRLIKNFESLDKKSYNEWTNMNSDSNYILFIYLFFWIPTIKDISSKQD